MKIVAYYSVQFCTLTTKVTENAKVYKYSLVDVVMDPTNKRPFPTSLAQLQADPTYLTAGKASSWTDKYWNIDFLKVFGLDLATYTTFYGKDKLFFTLSFFKEASNTHANELLPTIWTALFP